MVVQTSVNYQVAAVIVTHEETTCMLLKALQIIKANFNNLDVIFSFSFLISLFPFYQYSLLISLFSYDFRAYVSGRVKETLARNGLKGQELLIAFLGANYAFIHFLLKRC